MKFSFLRVFNLVVGYAHDRLPWKIWGGVSLLLALGAQIAIYDTTQFSWSKFVGGFVYDVFLSFLLVAGWRLWDDLADLEHDCQCHPARFLVRNAEQNLFFALLAVVLTLAVLVTSFEAYSLKAPVVVLLVNFCLFLWYGFFHKRKRNQIYAKVLILSKYPAVVAILGFRHASLHLSWLVFSQIMILGFFIIYEFYHPSV